MNRMDDLLRETLRSRAADPSAACVDAETAAAFVDGTLSARARSSAEAHIADCARCQAVLAAIVRSTPPPIDRAWWRRPAVAWLIPAAAAAAALAIWIRLPDSAGGPSVQMARSEPAPLDSSPIEPAAIGAAVPQAQPQIPSALERLTAADKVIVREGAEASARARVTGSSSEAAAGGNARKVLALSPAAPAPPPPAAAASPAAPAPAAAAPPSDGARADAANAAAPTVETVTVSGAAPVVENVPVATFRTGLVPIIVSSNRASQWRVGNTGQVQHSTDGGRTWRSQSLGVKETPVAGSSPSPSVCWLVGRGGLVLITTDSGRSWRRLPFSVVVDLASVRAADDKTATIVAADGRTFTTSDGGSSWK